MGGKKALRDVIVSRFPLHYDTYIEVFGGAAWVLFHKLPGRDIEIYNDFNSFLVNLFRVIQEQPDKFIDSLRYSLNSREEFERICYILDNDPPTDDVLRASMFYRRMRYSYGNGLESFAGRPCNIQASFPLIQQASKRLRYVVIEHRDFEYLIRSRDSPMSFFYCDPPYHNTEMYYHNIGEGGFTERDHFRLRDTLLSIKGKFLLSYNDDEFVRKLYDRPGIYMEAVTRPDSMRHRYKKSDDDEKQEFAELLISNYDTSERGRLIPTQITLF